ncbi:unnamed protein product [Rotaria sp. Silwood2]|nr:unnamed protein product [Rotaria sp. Silwood2]
MTETPLITVSDDIFNDANELTSSILKFAIDKDYHDFLLQKFLHKICNIMNINLNDIDIKKIQKGSTILEMEIFKNIGSKLRKIKLIYKSITDQMRKELGKLKIFFIFMGDIKSLEKRQKDSYEIKLHPEWNQIYAQNHTYWVGANNDGIDRGNQPYYCPVGWKRYSLYVADDFREEFKGWCICYHGTKFEYGLSILLSGLKSAKDQAHGPGIYTSPSIIYASHPRYAEIKLVESSVENDFFEKGQFIQFVLECRVLPKNIKIKCETLRVHNQAIIDVNISNDKIEWLIDTHRKDLMNFNDPNSVIFCTGIMIRVTDNHPGLLPVSKWWYVNGTLDYLKSTPLERQIFAGHEKFLLDFVNLFKQFDAPSEFLSYIFSIKSYREAPKDFIAPDPVKYENIFVILSNAYDERLTARIHDLSYVEQIYIYVDCDAETLWIKKYLKVRGPYSVDNLQNMFRTLAYDAQCALDNLLPITIFDPEPTEFIYKDLTTEQLDFPWFQLLLRVLQDTPVK